MEYFDDLIWINFYYSNQEDEEISKEYLDKILEKHPDILKMNCILCNHDSNEDQSIYLELIHVMFCEFTFKRKDGSRYKEISQYASLRCRKDRDHWDSVNLGDMFPSPFEKGDKKLQNPIKENFKRGGLSNKNFYGGKSSKENKS